MNELEKGMPSFEFFSTSDINVPYDRLINPQMDKLFKDTKMINVSPIDDIQS